MPTIKSGAKPLSNNDWVQLYPLSTINNRGPRIIKPAIKIYVIKLANLKQRESHYEKPIQKNLTFCLFDYGRYQADYIS